MRSVNLRGWHLRIVKTVTQAHLQFSSYLREGVECGGGWERINSFSFFKENKQYKRMINNWAASLWKNILNSAEKILRSRDLCFQVTSFQWNCEAASAGSVGNKVHKIIYFWPDEDKLITAVNLDRVTIQRLVFPSKDFFPSSPSLQKFDDPFTLPPPLLRPDLRDLC